MDINRTYPWWSRHLSVIEDCVREVCPEIPLTLVLAIIQVESGGNTYAARFEPGFLAWLKLRLTNRTIRANSAVITRQTELILRSTSFGLMQIMGQVARERGFNGAYLTELCEPKVGVTYGCLQLKHLYRRYNQNTKLTIAAYNAGSPRYTAKGELVNAAYVAKVTKYLILFAEILASVSPKTDA